MLIALLIILVIVFAIYIFMRSARFGSMAKGEQLKKIHRSSNYKHGQFQNLSNTPQITEGASIWKVMKEFFFGKDKRNKPKKPLPSRKHNLSNLENDTLVWFGHSSYFMKLNGKNILVDPVLCGHASPLAFTTKSFKGTNGYTPGDIPDIDYLFISHDHYDHFDYETMIQLRPKIKRIITGLGTAAHLERWGYDKNIIDELDWNEEVVLNIGFKVIAAPARHFSGRTFKRNSSLWTSFVLITATSKIFLGGDSGYDMHFQKIGEQYGPFDLAILESGQYNKYWKYIHMMPEETVQAAIDLKAKKLLPVHWGKFALSLHAWDEPIRRVLEEADKKELTVLHPMIGDTLDLNSIRPSFRWWEDFD